MLDYTTLDFETANAFRGSPCSIGLVKVRDGVPVARRHWLMRPPEGRDEFEPFQVALHGITPGMVADAPRWREILPDIVAFIGEDVVVAHNAAFDIGVLRSACLADGIPWPAFRFLCTLVLSRRALQLPSYRLPFVARALGVDFENHHHALADANGVVKIVNALASLIRAGSIEDLAAAYGIRVGEMHASSYRGSVAAQSGGSSALERAEDNPEADPEGYLYGRVVVFTGALTTMTRQIAWDAVVKAGGIPDKATTKRTNVLVVGDINPASLRPGAALTGKAEKAFKLQDAGQDIELMTEIDFLQVLSGDDLLMADPSSQPVKPKVVLEAGHGQLVAQVTATAPPARLWVRPLTHPPRPTTQACSAPGCDNVAAFKTRTKPTWCDDHITGALQTGGLEPLAPFTNPGDYRLTRCLKCGCVAHYRFEYVLQKNDEREQTCRACYWREWAKGVRSHTPWTADRNDLNDMRDLAEAFGYDYGGPLTVPSLREDPHLVTCRVCGLISAVRPDDIQFGCPCQRGARRRERQKRPSRMSGRLADLED